MLDISGLDVYRGGLPVLLNVSMRVSESGFVVVLGANGAGKSSLLQAISGLLRKVDGSIKFHGQPILRPRRGVVGSFFNQMHPHQIVRLGICQVPEGRQLFPRLTVLENLKAGAFVLSDRREVKRRLEQVLTAFPAVARKLRMRADSLSGGEQQMAAIARALMSSPRLLMLDEPSTGLAPRMVSDVLAILQNLKRELGCAVLVVEQNVEAALQVAEYLYVLESGRVVTHGTRDALKNDPSIREAYLG